MNQNNLLSASLIFSSVLIAGALIYSAGLKTINSPESQSINASVSQSIFSAEEVIPANGVELPVKWRHVEGSKVSPLPDTIEALRDLALIILNFYLGRYDH